MPHASAQMFNYPPTETIDHTDTYHGIEVHDPYHWLEEDVRESARVKDWVTAQNKVTFGYFKSVPQREPIRERLTELWNFEKYETPFKKSGRYYFSKNDGLQNHFVLYVADTFDGPRRILLNPNTWSKDGTLAFGRTAFSDDGRYVAYGVQEAGSDWHTWKVRDIDTGKDLSDTLHYLKFTSVAWDPQSQGFYYAKYPDPDPSKKFQALNKKMKVMYHRLGTEQVDDKVVYHRPEHPDWDYFVWVTEDSHYLIITIWRGTDEKHRIVYKDLTDPRAAPLDLISEFKNKYRFINNVGPIFYFLTDEGAPKRRVIAIDIRNPDKENWREVIAESDTPLKTVNIVSDLFLCSTLVDVTMQVKVYTLDGEFVRTIELPGLGTASGFGGRRDDTETFYSFQSMTSPPAIFRYDLVGHQSSPIECASVDMNPDDYTVDRFSLLPGTVENPDVYLL